MRVQSRCTGGRIGWGPRRLQCRRGRGFGGRRQCEHRAEPACRATCRPPGPGQCAAGAPRRCGQRRAEPSGWSGPCRRRWLACSQAPSIGQQLGTSGGCAIASGGAERRQGAAGGTNDAVRRSQGAASGVGELRSFVRPCRFLWLHPAVFAGRHCPRTGFAPAGAGPSDVAPRSAPARIGSTTSRRGVNACPACRARVLQRLRKSARHARHAATVDATRGGGAPGAREWTRARCRSRRGAPADGGGRPGFLNETRSAQAPPCEPPLDRTPLRGAGRRGGWQR